MRFLKAIFPIIVVAVLSFWAVKHVALPGFFPMHDDTQVVRVHEMTKSLKDGMFPVRWVSGLGYGYGYPIFNFYAPLSYYVGSAIELLGFDALSATKIMMGFGILLSGVFMYLLGKEFWGKLGGVVSALFYVYVPFHAVDIYVRGDVAEFWAYAFIPLAFFGIYKVFQTKGDFKWVVIGGLGYAGIILSHNLTAMMVTPFILIIILLYFYIALKRKELYAIRYPLYALALGLSLSAFYFIPALAEQKYTNVLSQIGGGAHFDDHFVCLPQLWQSQWGFGGSTPGCADGLSFMIGKLHIFASFLMLGLVLVSLLFKKIAKKEEKLLIAVLCALGLLVSILLMLSISNFLWKTVPLMAFFQYPWRFLLLASFFSSLLAGSLLWFAKILIKNDLVEWLLTGLLILLVILNGIKFFIPQTILNKMSEDYVSAENIRWTTSKISDEYLPKNFQKPQNVGDVANERIIFNPQDIKINKKIEKAQIITLDLNSAKETNLYFNIAHFPSWKLTVDGSVKGNMVGNGYGVSLAPGHHMVSMKFEETPIEKLSNFISVVGLVVVLVGIIRIKKKQNYG
ncbi:MAG: 6-pyruvoyl-tetrahydropterin synthase-related protein [Candidatus Levyibacteriota bacterium]